MIKLGNRKIDNNLPCYIIAEAGVNHNGDVNIAKELIKQAKWAGADCVKFQTFKAEQIITKNAPKAKYQLEVTDKSESQFEMLKSLELSRENYIELMKYCKELNIEFLSTPYNHEDADFLESLGVNAFKIASGQIIELAFLNHVAKKGKPIILSTGMANMSEVAQAVDSIRSTGNNQLVILQCTTNYPSRLEDANIMAMQTMQTAFQVMAGYSDHIERNYACYAAVSMGARVIEKHFTLDKNMPGPDHSSSLNPFGFKELVKGIKAIELALGNGLKSPCLAEIENAKGMRRSIATKKSIKKGEELSSKNIGFKRPYNGIRPQMYEYLVGQKASLNIDEDTLLQYGMVDWKLKNL